MRILGILLCLLLIVGNISTDKSRQDDIFVTMMQIINAALAVFEDIELLVWPRLVVAVNQVHTSAASFTLEPVHFTIVALVLTAIMFYRQRQQMAKLQGEVVWYSDRMDRYNRDIRLSDKYYRDTISGAEKKARENYLAAKRAEVFEVKAQKKMEKLERHISKFGAKSVECPDYCLRLLPRHHMPPMMKTSRGLTVYIIREEGCPPPPPARHLPAPVYRPSAPAKTNTSQPRY